MLTTIGLTNGGATTHYQFQYDDSLSGPGGPEPARTNAVMAECERDFGLMSSWFKNIALGVSFPSGVSISQNDGGASWSARGAKLSVAINPGRAGAAGLIRYLLVSEITEVFMMAQGLGWFDAAAGDEGSIGEGLSRFLGAQFLAAKGLGNIPDGYPISNIWLNSSRIDHVDQPATSDNKPDERTGCSCLFIWYLNAQLGYSVNDIVASGSATLAGVYAKLTGDAAANAFVPFKALADLAFPGISMILTGNLDNPFPIPFLIEGTIVDSKGNFVPDAGVEVTSLMETLKTTFLTSTHYQLSGNARFYSDAWTVTASARGYDALSVTLKLPNGAHVVQNFVLQQAAPGAVTGVVTDDGGTGLARSHVWIGSSTGPFATVSDVNGKYTLANVPPGPAQVTASHGSLYLPSTSAIIVPEGRTTLCDIALVRRRGGQ
jgi:hypothetical protein